MHNILKKFPALKTYQSFFFVQNQTGLLKMKRDCRIFDNLRDEFRVPQVPPKFGGYIFILLMAIQYTVFNHLQVFWTVSGVRILVEQNKRALLVCRL